ncbi:PREDICTED: uncharacterized protein LOC101305147 isoform 1 [Fragaria vesca subsp. vesca]
MYLTLMVCVRSGGFCGFDNNEVICSCSDRSYDKTCDDDLPSSRKTTLLLALAGRVGKNMKVKPYLLAGAYEIRWELSLVLFTSLWCLSKKYSPYDELHKIMSHNIR